MTISLTIVERNGDLQRASAERGTTLMQTLRDAGRVEAICGGEMACGTCAVRVADGWSDRLPPQSDLERGLLEGLGVDGDGVRLSCQIVLADELHGLEFAVLHGS